MTSLKPQQSSAGPEVGASLAILMIMAAGIVLSGMDVTGKYLSMTFPVLMVVWGRYFFHTALMFGIYTAKYRSLVFLRAKHPKLQLIRALSMLGVTGAMYTALREMPLGDASAVLFLAPVLVTLGSGLFLGEHVGARRLAAVAVAFIGVVVVVRPGSGVFGWVAVLPLAAAVMLAVYMIMTRIMRTKDHRDVTTFYSTAVGALALSAVVPFAWHALSPFEWVLMATMGFAGAAGHYLVVRAFHSAEASMLAPFTYFQVMGAIMWGYIVFGDVPSLWTALGAGMIAGSGIYVWYRETFARRPSIEGSSA